MGCSALVEDRLITAPRPRSTIPGKPAGGEVDDRLDEYPHLLELARAVALRERLVDAEAGVVDEDLDGQAARGELARELLADARRGTGDDGGGGRRGIR
jgi:hypothetical protein